MKNGNYYLFTKFIAYTKCSLSHVYNVTPITIFLPFIVLPCIKAFSK